MQGTKSTSKSVKPLWDYRIAVRARLVDDREMAWAKPPTKALFAITGAGQELAQIAAVKQLLPGDWVRGYYRSGASSLFLGTMTPRQMFAQILGDTAAGNDPSSGGRMMGRHHGSRLCDHGVPGNLTETINHASDTSCTGTQMPVAFGIARASRVFREVADLAPFTRLSHQGDEVTLVSIGDGSLAEGVSWEAMAQAVVQRAPLVVSALDNQYAISTPVDLQLPHGSASAALAGLASTPKGDDGLRIVGPVEGWDYPALCDAYEEAFDYVRRVRMPALVHTIVTQPQGHSSSGSHQRYKSEERLAWETKQDCLVHMRRWLLDRGFASEAELDAIEREEKALVDRESNEAWEAFREPLETIAHQAVGILDAFSRSTTGRLAEMCSRHLATLQERIGKDDLRRHDAILALDNVLLDARHAVARDRALHDNEEIALERVDALRRKIVSGLHSDYSTHVYAEDLEGAASEQWVRPVTSDQSSDTQAHIISAGIASLMNNDPRIVLTGEDVGRLGGVKHCTLGLQEGRRRVEEETWNKSPALQRYLRADGFGPRVWDHAIAESTIVGSAVGMALRGLKPIVEIQFLDYVVWGLQQMVDEAATLRYRTAGGQRCPLLIRTHGHRQMGMWHAGSPMGMVLSSCPGLRILVPRNAVQAISMYRTVLDGGDPAFSVEPLETMGRREPLPTNLEHVRLPLGMSEVLREGSDVTIITYGYCCSVALDAATRLADLGVSAEVIDLQTLNPLDSNRVAELSIWKTGLVIFLDEDIPEGAAAIIAKVLLLDRGCMDGIRGTKVVTGPHHKPPYGRDGAAFCKPQSTDVVAAVVRLLTEWKEYPGK